MGKEYHLPKGDFPPEEIAFSLLDQEATLREIDVVLNSSGMNKEQVDKVKMHIIKLAESSFRTTLVDCLKLKYIGEEPFLIRTARNGGFMIEKNQFVILPDNAFGRAYAHKTQIFEVIK